ncbi:MAG: serine/threonine protein kinase [Phycisphaeraceae bacterium]|nr:serine/threonine protein kinase [Phycisphaerales bacterium]MCB9859500.1 serine/threonine protein kinase [Phycisphaeraceae bacterium]
MRVRKKGDILEGYEILAELGQGAASVVYLVQDPKTSQIWAMKQIVRDTAKDQRFLDQALAEYEVARQLDHPSIRKIYKCLKKKAILQVKELYLLMELVDGTPMDEEVPETQLECVLAFHQMAEALQYMHAKGFIHADMKPHNCIRSDEGIVKLIDLGQSCPKGTVKPRIQGTPDYIAPEQVARQPITEVTDVYNLGATMYWILTKKNIPTAIPKGDSLVSTIDANMVQKATPVSELVPEVNSRLNDLVMECVEPDRSRRPRSMGEVLDRLNLVESILRAEAEKAKRVSQNSSAESNGAAADASRAV